MKKFQQIIGYKEIAAAVDLPINEICNLIDPKDLSELTFRYLEKNEILEVEDKVQSTLNDIALPKAGADRLDTWEQGWSEILVNIRSEGVTRKTLTPQYFHHNTFRYAGRYIQSETYDFEQNLFEIFRTIIVKKYLETAGHIVELGCGTGINLFLISKILKNTKLTGCDWSEASQQIISHINLSLKEKIVPINLNLLTLKGWENIEINSTTAILTFHALEQLGANTELLIAAIVDAKPQICVHIEPIIELYDLRNEFDKKAHSYHIKRNYLKGFYSSLIRLENSGKIKLLKVKRTEFGSKFHEAYTIIVWKVV